MGDDLLTLKRRLCLEIAEQLETVFRLRSYESTWDVDEAAALLESILPSTRNEAILEDARIDAEMMRRLPPRQEPTGPGLATQLRDVLGLSADTSLRELFRVAIERVRGGSPCQPL